MMGMEELDLDVFRLSMFAYMKNSRVNQCELHYSNFY